MRDEKREAKMDGARLVRNSGRGEEKGDAILTTEYGEWLIDYKHYQSTFSVSKKSWLKLAKDAWNSKHKSPVIKVCYEGVELAIIDWGDFECLNEGYHFDQ